MKKTEMKVKITMLEDILGTLPGDPEVYKSYIASKAPETKSINDEIELIGEEGVYEKGMTVFIRNKQGNPCLFDYLIKGFFKNAASALRGADDTKTKKLAAHKKKIDNLVFISPRLIEIHDFDEIAICERPLRASTAQGERVALSCSESIPAGSTIEFTVTCLSKDMMDYVIEWLDYGEFNGLGQWHNSGKGRFTWEQID